MSEITIAFKGKVSGGEVNLSRYPNLVYTAETGVCTHIAGVSVGVVAKQATAGGVIEPLDHLAAEMGLSFDELCDALRFARAGRII